MKTLFQKFAFIGCLLILIASCSPLKKYASTAKTFESQVKDLEALDKTETFKDDYILYIGSSSIRLWDSIHKDMAPYYSVKRGYGGAHFYDLIHFTERLVTPHKKAKAIVCFVANDLTGIWDNPKTKVEPQQVKRLFKYFTNQIVSSHWHHHHIIHKQRCLLVLLVMVLQSALRYLRLNYNSL